MSPSWSWFPWRFIVRRLARAHGFIDPLTAYARLQRFARPAEVAEPVELLRAGVVFHARGLINSRAIQHNLDWVWPYWVERQFDPADVSFLPRAFSLTHVNLTHRNWTAIGLPGREVLPIVDPRGLLTPFWDSWSIDVWLGNEDGELLLPSRSVDVDQTQSHDAEGLAVVTEMAVADMSLHTEARLITIASSDVCRVIARGIATCGGWLIVALRPCNPEGVSFVDEVALDATRRRWQVNRDISVRFDQPVERHQASDYHGADVRLRLDRNDDVTESRCPIGLATAAAMFRLDANVPREIRIDVPVSSRERPRHDRFGLRSRKRRAGPRPVRESEIDREEHQCQDWRTALEPAAELRVPDRRVEHLYQAALRTLVLCTPGEVYAGPYTYRRYWYRDAVFIGHGLLLGGLIERAERIVRRFPDRQTRAGYYHSQAGEWDANGEVLWLSERLGRFAGRDLDRRHWQSLAAGADWIVDKRLRAIDDPAHDGLMPAGFSAEHLGPNDHYYWDNAWSLAGLDSASRLAMQNGDVRRVRRYRDARCALHRAIERSLERREAEGYSPAIPAAPTRRLDAGAIGSLAFSYPLQILPPQDARVRGTLDYLLAHCFHQGGFFQDMIHSGVNAYLSLHVAQALLRDGDTRHEAIVRRVAELASPTGHWPEAVHPRTGGGCMGDGHHAWAAAEWIAMMRNLFLREEGESLHIARGLPSAWLQAAARLDGDDGVLSFGPAPCTFGVVSVRIERLSRPASGWRVSWTAHWHDRPPALVIGLPGYEVVRAAPSGGQRSGYVDLGRGAT